MAKTLSEQIQAALAPDARLATVNVLLHDVRRAVTDAKVEEARHHATAVSPDSDDVTADAAAEAEMKAARKVTRLEAQLAQVEARATELERAAEKKQYLDRVAAITAERDQIAADLNERWPVLVEEMMGLINRVLVNEPRCEGVMIPGPEQIARGLAPNFSGPAGVCPRIIEMDIVGMDNTGKLLRRGNRYWAMGAWE